MKIPIIFCIILFAALILNGCASFAPSPSFTYVEGTVSTVNNGQPQHKLEFFIDQPDPLSIRDKQISNLIARKLIEIGFIKAFSQMEANVLVKFNYSVGQGTTEVSSQPDFFWGHETHTDTSYPRNFQLAIIDLEKSHLPDHMEIIWQGEISSEGPSSNIMKLAQPFIDVLFENYGKTVNSQKFKKLFSY